MSTFAPGSEWVDVPPGAVLPPGCEIQMDMTTGRQQARCTAAQPNGDALHEVANNIARLVDRSEISRFVDAMFRHAGEGTWINLRAFRDDIDNAPPVAIQAVPMHGDLEQIVDTATAMARRCAAHQHPAVFCSPVASFTNREKADEASLANGLALSVELDADAGRARKRLEFLLGPATVVVASGGTWISPETGEVEDKLHLHWRLSEATSTPEAHAKLKRARAMATALVGGDASNKPVVHPIRWPGSVHRKAEPKLCRIIACNPEREIGLHSASGILLDIQPEFRKTDSSGRAPGEGEDRETPELVRALMAGEDFHSALLALAMRFLKRGMAPEHVTLTLRGLMQAIQPEHRDGSQPGRWQARYDDIPRAVQQGEQKLRAERPAAGSWPEPAPLFAEHEKPEPYPIDALPPIMRAAVEAYQAFGQQPIELVACSALSTASLACQALADVDRDGNLTGPCSLSLITVAVSGERKTAADKRMRRALVTWQDEKRKEQAPAINAAERRLSIWEARRDGMMAKIKRLSGSTKLEDEVDRRALEEDLVRFDIERPRVPPVTKLFFEDVTPERLASSLSEGWPSSSLWSDEGGLVIGSHAMSEDVALRFLALLNRLWNGNPFDRDRETRSCAYIRGRRFTASLMLQPAALAKLVAAGGGIARAIGALARYLIAWPTSTMGTRLYKPGDLNDPVLCAFDMRLRRLLDMPLPLDDDGALDPPILRLTPDAIQVWRQLHDDIERELGSRGEFSDLPDFGAKIAEQGARIACVLHVVQNGPVGEIDQNMMMAGARIALWHLHEARRVIGMIGHVGEAADAQTLLEWLQERSEPTTLRDIQRLGPYRLRDKERRDGAVAKLVEHCLARVDKQGHPGRVLLNPAIQS